MEKKKVWVFVVGVLFLLDVFAWQEVFALNGDKNLEVYFLNVGQGDSEFIKTPENHQIIIDGGPDSLVLTEISKLMPFWDRTIDLVVLSHPEKDHMQGLLEILKKYKADYILWSGVEKTAPGYNEWINVLERQKKLGAKIIATKSGDIVRLGEVKIETISPLENLAGQKMGDSSNDACVVAKLIFGNNSFLFTGDIPAKTEKELVGIASSQASRNDVLKADVLKIAHHGSKYSTSEEFLQNVKPKFAVIEVGKNSYGHPTPETLQRLEKFGIQILRTDINGTIEFVSDGENIKLIDN